MRSFWGAAFSTWLPPWLAKADSGSYWYFASVYISIVCRKQAEKKALALSAFFWPLAAGVAAVPSRPLTPRPVPLRNQISLTRVCRLGRAKGRAADPAENSLALPPLATRISSPYLS